MVQDVIPLRTEMDKDENLIDLKCIVPSERSQTQMSTLTDDSIYITSLQRQIIGTEMRLVVARCSGGGWGF